MEAFGNLADEIDVQAGATVSKVLVRGGPVRVVLFAFDAGEELTEHTASVPAVVEMVEGAATITASGHAHLLTPGGWIILDAGEPHSVVAEEPCKLLLTMIKGA